jgi:AcrR family transcriptional regulator
MVVTEAGLTKGAVYSRFRSKADLFLALLEERIERRIVEMRTTAAEEHGSLGLATALSRQWDERLRTDGEWSRLTIEFRLHAARVPVLNRRYAALHARLRGVMADLIEREARETGETLPIPSEDLARAALALGTGAVLERCAEGDAFPEHLNEITTRAIVHGLAAAVAPSAPRVQRRVAR